MLSLFKKQDAAIGVRDTAAFRTEKDAVDQKVAVVGAGAVGANAALFLARRGFSVELIDEASTILQGASLASFILHVDGLEYYKRGEWQTGMDCIDGALAKSLIYPAAIFRTSVCSERNPACFSISSETARRSRQLVPSFRANAERMRLHFARRFEGLRGALGWTAQRAGECFLCQPSSFARELEETELADLRGVVVGYAGSSAGANMPRYYALLRAALRRMGIEPRPGRSVEGIRRMSTGRYRVQLLGDDPVEVDHVILSASHHIPGLIEATRPSFRRAEAHGTYFLNGMTLLALPRTSDARTLSEASRIHFVLQQEHGAMYACIVPPTEREEGVAAAYFSSPSGSQLLESLFDSGRRLGPPPYWDSLQVLGSDHPHVARVVAQAKRFYPFLERLGARPLRMICKPVFNSGNRANRGGEDRRVRRIRRGPILASRDGRVSAWSAPKWTNAELVALLATDHVLRTAGRPPLPTSPTSGLGPTSLDVAKISQEIHFRDIEMDAGHAIEYADRQGLPRRIVSERQTDRA